MVRNANLSSETRVLFHSRPKDSCCILNQVPLAPEKSQFDRYINPEADANPPRGKC